MKISTWLNNPTDSKLEVEVIRKISIVREFEKEVPAVIIIHDLANSSVVYLSQRGLDHFRLTLEEIQIPNSEYHSKFFNADDTVTYVPKIIALVENNSDELVSYFQQVRRSAEEPWVWYLSSTKVFLRDSVGKPRLIITSAQKVDVDHPISVKVEKVLEETRFIKLNHSIFLSLTRREKQILEFMALGQSTVQIAADLNISEKTANTHRRNVRQKINAHSPYDITRFAQAFDLI